MLKFSFGALTIAAVLGLGFSGFRGTKTELTHIEWFDDMAHQAKGLPQHHSEFFEDLRLERERVPGTVPIGFTLDGRYYQSGGNNLVDGHGGFTNQPDYYNTGRMGDVYGDGIPEELAARGAELIERGEQRFNINCAICHGLNGKASGVIKTFGLIAIHDLTAEDIRKQPDGKIYNTITHGRLTMGAYGPIITVEDRWAIVAYVRVLEKAADGSLNPPPAAAAPAPKPAEATK